MKQESKSWAAGGELRHIALRVLHAQGHARLLCIVPDSSYNLHRVSRHIAGLQSRTMTRNRLQRIGLGLPVSKPISNKTPKMWNQIEKHIECSKPASKNHREFEPCLEIRRECESKFEAESENSTPNIRDMIRQTTKVRNEFDSNFGTLKHGKSRN